MWVLEAAGQAAGALQASVSSVTKRWCCWCWWRHFSWKVVVMEYVGKHPIRTPVHENCSISVGFSSHRISAFREHQELLWFALHVPFLGNCYCCDWLSLVSISICKRPGTERSSDNKGPPTTPGQMLRPFPKLNGPTNPLCKNTEPPTYSYFSTYKREDTHACCASPQGKGMLQRLSLPESANVSGFMKLLQSHGDKVCFVMKSSYPSYYGLLSNSI